MDTRDGVALERSYILQKRIKPHGMKILVETHGGKHKNLSKQGCNPGYILSTIGGIAVGACGTLGLCHLAKKGYLSLPKTESDKE